MTSRSVSAIIKYTLPSTLCICETLQHTNMHSDCYDDQWYQYAHKLLQEDFTQADWQKGHSYPFLSL